MTESVGCADREFVYIWSSYDQCYWLSHEIGISFVKVETEWHRKEQSDRASATPREILPASVAVKTSVEILLYPAWNAAFTVRVDATSPKDPLQKLIICR